MNDLEIRDEITTTEETFGEVRLWQAVLVRTIEEWMWGSMRHKRQAEHFLFHDRQDFQLVCQCAGMDPDDLRARLAKIRTRQPQQQMPALAA